MGKVLPIRRPAETRRQLSDEALMAACGTGDTSALAELFDRFSPDVHRFLVRLRGADDHSIDDLVQDTFLHAFDGAGRFAGRSAVRTWLLAVAANLVKTYARGEVRRKERGRAYLELQDAEAAGPDLLAERRQLMARMSVALEGLPHDQRVVFLLCDVEGVRGVDAAKALGLREGTLYRRLHDARKAVRAAVLGGGT
ncbi:MAG: RNA polymerase sigma factor [Myxococcales bacterium]|nr:RNA polymerase sigma factor [Myxococcales bacterium]